MAEHHSAASLRGEGRIEVSGRVERALNSLRLAVAGILTSVGLSAGFGVGDGWYGVVAGFGAVAALVALFRLPPTRNAIVKAMDWVIGRS